MKIAVVYNREHNGVINLFGTPNREKYQKVSIKRITDGLKKFGHQVKSFEGDKDLIRNLESFMPRVLKGELPGLVFNLSYGIQGNARYTHVPGILEMIGIPYVGSNPLSHSLALDKVVAKMIFCQHGIPTPEFVVLDNHEKITVDLPFPLIVKPKNEAVSMGIQIVTNEEELKSAVTEIFKMFNQSVLVERYIEGREINVALIGNNPPEALPPCEIVFPKDKGPRIYTIEDKKHTSGREIEVKCPVSLSNELIENAKQIALKAYLALGCYDFSRVDMRLDKDNNLYVLEINSLPSLGEHGSFTHAAHNIGLDFPQLVNRLAETASARYFGTPKPSLYQSNGGKLSNKIFSFITERRDQIEKRLEEWVSISSRTYDPAGNRMIIKKLNKLFDDLKMKPINEFVDGKSCLAWNTKEGFEKGILFLINTDISLEQHIPFQSFRHETECLYGEGIGISRAPLTMLEFTLRSLKFHRVLNKIPLGVLVYQDEGLNCLYSSDVITAMSKKAKRVLVLKPSTVPNALIVQRRGQRVYRLTIEGDSQRVGQKSKKDEVLLAFNQKLQEICNLTSKKQYIAVSATDVKTDAFPLLLPHRVTAKLVLSYLDTDVADQVQLKIKKIFSGRLYSYKLDKISDSPPMKENKANIKLSQQLHKVAEKWDIPLKQSSSVLPSAGGLVSPGVPVICGIAPSAANLYTPHEAINRTSLIQRILLLAQFLSGYIEE